METLASRRFLVFVLLLALVLRVAWAFAAGDEQRFYDSDSYIKIADNLLAGKGFLWGDQRAGRPPLYPLVVAAARFELLGRQFLALYLAQAVLGTAAVALFSLAANRLLGAAVGGTAALVLAIWPFLIFYTGAVLSEVLFIWLLSGTFCCLAGLLKRPRAGCAAAAGVFAGAAFLTRPSVLGLLLLFSIIVIAWVRPLLKGVRLAALTAAVGLAVALPWALRNKRVTGHMIFSTSGVGASLYDGLGPQADGSSDMSFVHDMPELGQMDEVALDHYLRLKALSAAAATPGRVLRLALVKVYRFWAPVPNNERFRKPLYAAVSLVCVLPVYLLSVTAVARRAVAAGDFVAIAAAPAYFTILHTAFVGSTRYRVPVMPFVVMLAAVALVRILSGGAPASGGSEAESA